MSSHLLTQVVLFPLNTIGLIKVCFLCVNSLLFLWYTELTTVSDFYYTKYKSSAPLLGFYSSSLLLDSSSTFSFFNIFFSSFRWIQRIQNGQVAHSFHRKFSLDSLEFCNFISQFFWQIQVDGEVVKDPNTLLRLGTCFVVTISLSTNKESCF